MVSDWRSFVVSGNGILAIAARHGQADLGPYKGGSGLFQSWRLASTETGDEWKCHPYSPRCICFNDKLGVFLFVNAENSNQVYNTNSGSSTAPEEATIVITSDFDSFEEHTGPNLSWVIAGGGIFLGSTDGRTLLRSEDGCTWDEVGEQSNAGGNASTRRDDLFPANLTGSGGCEIQGRLINWANINDTNTWTFEHLGWVNFLPSHTVLRWCRDEWIGLFTPTDTFLENHKLDNTVSTILVRSTDGESWTWEACWPGRKTFERQEPSYNGWWRDVWKNEDEHIVACQVNPEGVFTAIAVYFAETCLCVEPIDPDDPNQGGPDEPPAENPIVILRRKLGTGIPLPQIYYS